MFKYENCTEAAKFGDLEELKKMHDAGLPWGTDTSSAAAKHGHLDCLKWIHENGCPWDMFTIGLAGMNGHLDCIKYAHLQGCPRYVTLCLDAAKNGNLDTLKWAHENGFYLFDQTTSYAAQGGNLECLKWAHLQGCKFDEHVYMFAVSGTSTCQNIECIKYLHENNCKWTVNAVKKAAYKGKFAAFKYFFENARDVQDFWNTKYKLSKIIHLFDLDDPLWRQLLNINLEINPEIKTVVNAKKNELEQMKLITVNSLRTVIHTDVVTHCVCDYF
jgi:hypothetical protein